MRCVEHGNLLDDETITLLLDNDAFLVPGRWSPTTRWTSSAARPGIPARSLQKNAQVRDAGRGAGESPQRRGEHRHGSDLLGPLQTAQLEEFTLRAEVQPAVDIIRAATTTAARLLNLEGTIGTLAVGAEADLLVLDGNPLEDISVLTSPERNLRYVVRGRDPSRGRRPARLNAASARRASSTC